eukprot:tig00001126_g7131.t1
MAGKTLDWVGWGGFGEVRVVKRGGPQNQVLSHFFRARIRGDKAREAAERAARARAAAAAQETQAEAAAGETEGAPAHPGSGASAAPAPPSQSSPSVGAGLLSTKPGRNRNPDAAMKCGTCTLTGLSTAT